MKLDSLLSLGFCFISLLCFNRFRLVVFYSVNCKSGGVRGGRGQGGGGVIFCLGGCRHFGGGVVTLHGGTALKMASKNGHQGKNKRRETR